MNEFLSRYYHKLPPFLRNKYILTLVVFIVWIVLFDNNNLVDRVHNMKVMKQLEQDKEYYTKKIDEDTRKLDELRTDRDNLEKFAREQYHMKRDDEDLFLVVPKKEASGKKPTRK